jgi:branched-chain amino acid transport system ATP-binding protein
VTEVDHRRRLAVEVAGAFSGAQVGLIDHDVSLVRTVCTGLTVLGFGKVISAGPTEAVLDDPAVKRAYLGAEDL